MQRAWWLVILLASAASGRADTIALWDFTAPSGAESVPDASGFGNHAQRVGVIRFAAVAGRQSKVLHLAGQGLLEIPDAHVFDFRDDFTIEVVARTEDSGSQYLFVRSSMQGEVWIRQHCKGGHDAAVAALVKSEQGVDLLVSGPRAIADGRFHHVALVRRVSGPDQPGRLELLIDGRIVAHKTGPASSGPLAFSSLTSIGGLRRAGGLQRPDIDRPWIGQIAVVRVDDEALPVAGMLLPGGASTEQVLARNQAAAIQARIRSLARKPQPAAPQVRFNMTPTGNLGNFPRDFESHVQLFAPDDERGAIDPAPYKELFPEVLIHDVDGDGHLDIWTETRFYRNTAMYRDGLPIFAPFIERAAPAVGRTVADLDGDGRLEVISAQDKPPLSMIRRELIPPSADRPHWTARDLGPLAVVGLADAALQPLQPMTKTWPYETLDVADWDGDGLPDLICSGHPAPGGFEVGWKPALGWGFKRSFWPRKDPRGMLLASQIFGTVWWHRNLGTAQQPVFHPGRILTAGVDDRLLMHWGGVSSTVSDFDEDGDLDLWVHNTMGLFVYPNQGRPVDQRVYDNQRFQLGEPRRIRFDGHDEPLTDPGMLKVVDWSPAHRKCIVFREQGYGLLYFAPNRGTPKNPRYQQLSPWVARGGALSTGIFTIPKVADWDGDGLPDLLLGSQAGYVHFCRNLGGSTAVPQFATPVLLRAAGRLIQPRTLAGMTDVTFGAHFSYTNPEVVDWDHDGDLDLLLGWQGGSLLLHDNTGTRRRPKLAPAVAVRRDGKPIFAGARSRPAAVDLDRDGLVDLIAPDIDGYLVWHRRERHQGRLRLQKPARLPLENGNHLFASGHTGDQDDGSYAQRLNARIKLTAFDWDADGDIDLMVGNRGDGLRLFENVGSVDKALFRYTGKPDYLTNHPGGHYRMAEPCDFDGDGRVEMLTGADFGPVFYFARRPVQP